jgi:hypothetical protein
LRDSLYWLRLELSDSLGGKIRVHVSVKDGLRTEGRQETVLGFTRH